MNVMNNLMGGGATQSLADRFQAAKCSITGQGLAKAVSKATTEEILGPKRKHVDYLVQCTHEPNISIPQMADLLMDRSKHTNWVVVFKSLTTIHNVMNYGNERFTQYIASNNYSFNLSGFSDKTSQQGYDMSNFIRRYAKYINAKGTSYREMAFDFCKIKRGKDDGVLRTMPTDKLLKAMPALQQQVDVLLEFDASPSDLANSVVNAAFMLLFRDLIRLFACYNDGVINLLEKYFDMNKKQCREALDIYKKFLSRMDKVADFFKVAEKVGIDKGEIPDLTKAPASLLEALEQHLQSLENRKGGRKTATAVSNDDNAPASDDTRRQAALEEEKQHLSRLEQQKGSVALQQNTTPPAVVASVSGNTGDLLGIGFDAPAGLQHQTENVTEQSQGEADMMQMNKNSAFDSILAAYNQPARPPQPAMAAPFQQPYMAAPQVVQANATNPFMVGNIAPQNPAPSWPPAFPAAPLAAESAAIETTAGEIPASDNGVAGPGLTAPTSNPFLSPSIEGLSNASKTGSTTPDPNLFASSGPDPFSMLQPTPAGQAGTPTGQPSSALPGSGSLTFNNGNGNLDQTLATLASGLSLAPTAATTAKPTPVASNGTAGAKDPFGDL